MDKVVVKVRHFFDGVYMYIGLLLAMLGVIFLLFNFVVSLILFFGSLLVFSTVYKLAIFKEAGYYKNYLWLFGFKKGRKIMFKSLDGLMMEKHKHEHHLSKKNPDATIEYTVYSGYLIFDGEKKVSIGDSKNQTKIEKKISKLRDKLGISVLDSPMK
jgi:hypothetical protein